MSASSQFDYSLGDTGERSSTSSVNHKSYSMLKARLPTQKELTELYREVDSLRKDKKLKDDTIKFLQKEKEHLKHELSHYEQMCDGVVTDISTHRELEANNKQLQADILHLKDVIRRQNLLLRNTGTSGSTHLDRQLVTRLCTNVMSLLNEVPTGMSSQVSQEIEHQKETLERSSSKRAETTWHFLEVIDRAMIELKSAPKKSTDLPNISKPPAVLKYSNQVVTEPSVRQTNLTTTSSTSLANLSSTETLLMAGHARKRTGHSSGKLGRIGRLERSRSAPSLNGMIPHPPSKPAPSMRSIYNQPERPLTATVNMLDTLSAHPPGADF